MTEFQPTPLENFSAKQLQEFMNCVSTYKLEKEDLLRIRLPVLGSANSEKPKFRPGSNQKPARIAEQNAQNLLIQDALQEWFECESGGNAFHSANFWQKTARKALKDHAFCTDFRMRVWEQIAAIPRGQTQSYGEIAKVIQCKSPRAVGSACGANPWPLLIPCHRVVASEGIGGFSGDLGVKRWLLQAECR